MLSQRRHKSNTRSGIPWVPLIAIFGLYIVQGVFVTLAWPQNFYFPKELVESLDWAENVVLPVAMVGALAGAGAVTWWVAVEVGDMDGNHAAWAPLMWMMLVFSTIFAAAGIVAVVVAWTMTESVAVSVVVGVAILVMAWAVGSGPLSQEVFTGMGAKITLLFIGFTVVFMVVAWSGINQEDIFMALLVPGAAVIGAIYISQLVTTISLLSREIVAWMVFPPVVVLLLLGWIGIVAWAGVVMLDEAKDVARVFAVLSLGAWAWAFADTGARAGIKLREQCSYLLLFGILFITASAGTGVGALLAQTGKGYWWG